MKQHIGSQNNDYNDNSALKKSFGQNYGFHFLDLRFIA